MNNLDILFKEMEKRKVSFADLTEFDTWVNVVCGCKNVKVENEKKV